MFNMRASLKVFAGVSFVSMIGCGSGPSTGSTAGSPHANVLAGNWLLAGALPEGPFNRAAGVQLSVTFSTLGNQIAGLGMFLVPCPPSNAGGLLGSESVGGGFEASGTVAADGSFTVQSATAATNGTPLTSISIAGKIPPTSAAPWSGTYSISTPANGTCAVQEAGTISAQAIGTLSGTWVATGSYVDGATQVPVTATMVLQQGALSTSPSGEADDIAYALSGTLSVSGVPCFHTGTSVGPTTPQLNGVGGAVLGGMAFPAFRMDDGSLAQMNVYPHDNQPSQLDNLGMGVSSGNCSSTPTRQVKLGSWTRGN